MATMNIYLKSGNILSAMTNELALATAIAAHWTANINAGTPGVENEIRTPEWDKDIDVYQGDIEAIEILP